MRKRLLLLICILCTVAIFVGGTLAYFTDSVTATAEIRAAMIDIEQIEMQRKVNTEGLREFTQNQALYPAICSGEPQKDDTLLWKFDEKDEKTFSLSFWSNVENAVDKVVFVRNDSTTQAAFRTVYAFEAYTNFDPGKLLLNRNTTDYLWTDIGFGSIDGKVYYFMTATYTANNGVLEVGETAPPSLLQVALSEKATNEDVEKLGDTYEILVVTQATQANYGAPESVFAEATPQEIVAAVMNEYYKPENPDSPIYPPNESAAPGEP